MSIVNENIKKYYSNSMCIQCENDVCKVYGGRCRKYRRKHVWDKIIGLLNKNKLKDAVYKDGIFVCPNCEKSTFPLALHGGDYCLYCGQHVRWRGVIKQ